MSESTATVWTDEDLFRDFVANATRCPEVYRRRRLSGIPTSWLFRAGFPAGSVAIPRSEPLP